MRQKINSIISMYSKEFWGIILSVLALAAIMLCINNFTDMPMRHVKAIASENPLQAYNNTMASVNKVIGIITFTAIAVLFLAQKNSKDNLSFSEKICNIIMKKYLDEISPMNESAAKSALSIHFAATLCLASYCIYTIIYSPGIKSVAVAVSLLAISVFGLRLYKNRTQNKRITSIYIGASLVFPIIIHLYLGGFTSHSASIFWVLMSFVLALFILGRDYARKVFSYFIIIILIDVLIEMNFVSNINYTSIYYFVPSIFFIGFAIYAAIDIYVVRSRDNHAEVLKKLEELKNSQSALVHSEKMIMLGQLISGVAHEINTPIGAIKASADTISASLEQTLRSIIKGGRDFTDEDLSIFFKIMHYAAESLNEMRPTSELRRQRNELRKYLAEIELPMHNEIVDMLFRLEICDMEMVKENIEIFKTPNIYNILSLICNISSLLVGTETILVATGKVSKIVFALKSYSHTNVSDEYLPFDIIKSIETVLLLHHNQIKSSVSVERDFDENMPLCYGNSDELAQVWTNLIQNALYAMSNSGNLMISIKFYNDEFTIKITDTGGGIPEAYLPKIFDPFYTTKPVGEGSGLGLDICKKIITKHNGTLDVKSEVGTGSTFTVVLPMGSITLNNKEASEL